MSERFRSECDTWLIVLGFGAVAATVVGITPLLMADVIGYIKVVTGGLLILTVLLVSWVYVGTYYVIAENELLVCSGPFRWRIPVAEIHRITPTRSPLSSPALSLNRLRIDYGKGKWILLSPERREEFTHRLGLSIT